MSCASSVQPPYSYRSIPLGNVLCQFNPASIIIPFFQDPVVIHVILSNVRQYLLSRELSSYFRLKFAIPHVCVIRHVVIMLCEFSPLLLYIIFLLSSDMVTEMYLFICRVLFCSLHKSLSLQHQILAQPILFKYVAIYIGLFSNFTTATTALLLLLYHHNSSFLQ